MLQAGDGELDQIDDRPSVGAAGAVESIFSILALRDQAIPPTINLDNPDEGCDLDFVPHEARQSAIWSTLCATPLVLAELTVP